MYSVIVVDEDPMTVEQLRTEMNWENLGCVLAGTALSIDEGLFLVQKIRPDLVITDISSQKSDRDLLSILYDRKYKNLEKNRIDEAEEKYPAVIILSACHDFKEACRAIRYEASLYLTKPPERRELEEGISWVLARFEKQESRKNTSRLGDGRELSEDRKETDSSAICYHTLSELRRIRGQMDQYSPFVREAILFIDSHLKQELSLTVLCEELSLSHSYFSKKFKKETGTGYVAYVTMAKMEKARELMKDPRNKANEVASSLGYYDYSYFFQNFKRYFGCSPRQFKSQGRIPE